MKQKSSITRAAEQARDVERINAAADRLNAEMAEVLEFQAPWPSSPLSPPPRSMS